MRRACSSSAAAGAGHRRSSCSRTTGLTAVRCPIPSPDNSPLTPQASYGAQKAMCELLVYDMTRKGFVDGRSLRLPTVTVRPGEPEPAPRRRSRAASSASRSRASRRSARSRGFDAHVGDLASRRGRQSRRRSRGGRRSAFAHTRSVNVPGLCVAVGGDGELRCGAWRGDAAAERVKWQYDPAIDRIVSWPSNFAPGARARGWGMKGDADFDGIVRAYIEDDAPRA